MAQRGYITQFDAMRFFAAILTAAYHGDVIKMLHDSPDRKHGAEYHHIGAHCVTFFFVLSGFLITWLLLKEKDRTHTIDVKGFYLRRVLRIWPLYYLILILGLFLLPYVPYLFMPMPLHGHLDMLTLGQAFLWLTFFPNLHKVGLMAPQVLISHTWSIGMEEQFYAVWPWLVRKMRNPVWGILAVFGGFLFVRWAIYPFFSSPGLDATLEYFRFDCMALGGLFAWYYHSGRSGSLADLLKQPSTLYVLAAAWPILTLTDDLFTKAYYTPFLSIYYSALLLSMAYQPGRLLGLNHPALRYLGQISYGIYMYNVVACVLAINVMHRLSGGSLQIFLDSPRFSNALYYPLCLGFTIGLAALSYKYLELPFLNMKDRLSRKPATVGS